MACGKNGVAVRLHPGPAEGTSALAGCAAVSSEETQYVSGSERALIAAGICCRKAKFLALFLLWALLGDSVVPNRAPPVPLLGSHWLSPAALLIARCFASDWLHPSHSPVLS